MEDHVEAAVVVLPVLRAEFLRCRRHASVVEPAKHKWIDRLAVERRGDRPRSLGPLRARDAIDAFDRGENLDGSKPRAIKPKRPHGEIHHVATHVAEGSGSVIPVLSPIRWMKVRDVRSVLRWAKPKVVLER